MERNRNITRSFVQAATGIPTTHYLDVLLDALVCFVRCLLEVGELVLEPLVDLLVVALLLLHLLELCLNMLREVVD